MSELAKTIVRNCLKDNQLSEAELKEVNELLNGQEITIKYKSDTSELDSAGLLYGVVSHSKQIALKAAVEINVNAASFTTKELIEDADAIHKWLNDGIIPNE